MLQHTGTQPAKNQTILVVDDHPDLRWIYGEILSGNGFDVEVAEDGIDALKALEIIKKPSCILLDLHMPRMSGYRFFANLRRNSNWSDIPVVLASSEPYLEDIAAALRVKCIDKCSVSARLLEVISATITQGAKTHALH